MRKHNEAAEALIEALPYIQNFRGHTVVIKYGGAAMENEELVERVLKDVVFLEAVGINPVLVHGGGKAITRALKEKGITAQFVDGLRVSDPASMNVIEATLSTVINPRIVETIRRLGGKARGFHGGDVMQAERRAHRDAAGKEVDLGLVGEVINVDADVLRREISAEIVPVISPLGRDRQGVLYNVNADVAAGEVAQALGAYKLIYLSDVNGVMRNPEDKDSTISTLTIAQVNELKKKGIIAGGMIPKLDSAIEALERGVRKVHLLDGRIPHSLLLEIFTDAGIGTEITAS
jgi:acetylglutamate kinase